MNPVGWFEIYVQDADRARAFYEAVFQKPLTRLDSPVVEMWAFPMDMQKSGASGALVKYADKSSGVNSTIVYFSCEDCAVEEARAAENGGEVARPKISIGQYGFISLVLDPDGNMIGLHSLK
ncbi:MAG: VOC family protein [Verrucomicrobiae bacterium]|nr:VOC family protein [Verrucomicrobiae bacterium]